MAASASNVMNSFGAIVTSNNVPHQEYYLHGSIKDASVEVLLHKLRGLCDKADEDPKSFRDHEMSYSIKKGTALYRPSINVRVRRTLDDVEAPWQLRYVGETELSERNQPTAIRSSIEVGVSRNVVEFITAMGFKLNFEYVSRGYRFRKGKMKITVSKIFKLKDSNIKEGPVEPLTASYLVEMSVMVPGKDSNIGHEMRLFAEQLKPLVHMKPSVDEDFSLFV